VTQSIAYPSGPDLNRQMPVDASSDLALIHSHMRDETLRKTSKMTGEIIAAVVKPGNEETRKGCLVGSNET
jgi:hypothetical protein